MFVVQWKLHVIRKLKHSGCNSASGISLTKVKKEISTLNYGFETSKLVMKFNVHPSRLLFFGPEDQYLVISPVRLPGWQPWSNMMIMLWHLLVMVIHTRHGLITARSWHGHHKKNLHDHGIVFMEISMIIPWSPWSLL